MTARQWGEISLAALCFLVDALIELCQLPAANSATKSTPQLFIRTVREAGQTAWFSTAEWSVAQCVGDGRRMRSELQKVNMRIMKLLERSGAFTWLMTTDKLARTKSAARNTDVFFSSAIKVVSLLKKGEMTPNSITFFFSRNSSLRQSTSPLRKILLSQRHRLPPSVSRSLSERSGR